MNMKKVKNHPDPCTQTLLDTLEKEILVPSSPHRPFEPNPKPTPPSHHPHPHPPPTSPSPLSKKDRNIFRILCLQAFSSLNDFRGERRTTNRESRIEIKKSESFGETREESGIGGGGLFLRIKARGRGWINFIVALESLLSCGIFQRPLPTALTKRSIWSVGKGKKQHGRRYVVNRFVQKGFVRYIVSQDRAYRALPWFSHTCSSTVSFTSLEFLVVSRSLGLLTVLFLLFLVPEEV